MAQTLLEYVTSLQNQGIDSNSKPSISELVEEWKKKNPQPEVEEEETTKVEDVKENNISNNQQETVDKITSVAKPNETYAGFEGGEEFKYDIKPGEKYPSYYKREKGSENEWTPIDFKDDQYFDVGARVFKHFDYDEDAYKATQNILAKGGSDKVFDSFKETVGDLELNQKSLEGFENIDKIYQENIDVTGEQQDAINTQNDFFISNGQRDLSVSTGMFANKDDFLVEEKAVPQLQQKFKDTGIKFEEAGIGDFIKVTLPNGKSEKFSIRKGKEAYDEMNKFIGETQEDYKELENKAISEIASEQGLEPGVNFDVAENQEAIQDRVRQLKNDELVSNQRVENLTQYIQNLGTDFDSEEAGKYLRETFDFSTAGILKSTMGVATDILGIDIGQTKITDVFDKTDIQKQIQEYEQIKNSNLTEKGKNLQTFLKNGQGLLEDLHATANLLANADYQTPAQATEGRKQLANINKQIEGIEGLIEEKYNKFNEELKENPDGALFLDKIKRNYGVMPILVNNIKASTLEMGLGVEELAFQAYDLFSSTDSQNVEGVVQAVAQITPFEEHRKKAIELTDKYIEEGLRGTVAEAKSIEDVSSFGDFITWGSATTGSLIPQVAAMTMAPYTGLALVTASAGGSKFREYQKEMDASQKAYNDFIAAGGDPADAPEVVNYSKVQMWGGAMLNMGLEFGMGRLISLPLASGKSVMSPILGRFGALNSNPAIQSGWTKNFSNILKSGAVHVGDATLEGFEEGFIGIGDQWYNRYVLGKDVNLMDGFYDQFAAGFVGGGYFKAPGIIQSYLSPVQTPGDVSNITGLQNEIKSINNAIIQNPKMSQRTREVLENNIAEKVININNSINNSLNIYTELSEGDFKILGNLDQQLFNVNSQLEAVQEDAGIEVGKEQLIEDLTNKRNELTGQKNQLLDTYVKKDLESQASGGRIIGPVIQAGADVAAEQLGSGIQRFDNTQDLLGGIESLKAQGVQVNAKTDADGGILDAADQDYGLIATLPDGTKQIIINEASSQADGVIPADKHEVLHLAAAKMDPAKKVQMGTDLLNSLENDPNIEISDRVRSLLDSYKKDLDDGTISEADFYEEVMAVTSDGLTDGGVNIKDIGLFKSIGDKILETIGWKQSFEEGTNVINFLKDFNADIIKGEGLSKEVLGEVDMGLETEVDLGVVKSKKLPAETQTYMELDNDVLQQGLNDAIQNKTDQQFSLAQAVVEKNWPLISKSLNINNQQEMDAAKEVVIDQILGQFEGSGQGKYGPRKTSALAGFDLEGGAQVSTYLAETIRTRKPEIDAAIADRTGGPGVQVDQIRDVAVETEVTEVETTKPAPSETTVYSDAVLSNVDTNKVGLETNITEAITTAYDGRTDVSLAETRNIPQEVANVYATAFGLNPETIVDKRRNFSKKDADGLNSAKRFLLSNAQADYNRLPKTTDVEGKGTFIPKNVKDALYTNGKLTGTLKDYQDIIRIKPEKAIYRDRVGQTIRGLLNTHIRNRILETASPDAAVRQATGATFSKKAPVVTKPKKPKVKQKTINEITPAKTKQLIDVMAERDIKKVSESLKIKGRDITDVNRPERQASILQTIKDAKIPGPLFDILGLAGFGRRKVDGVRVNLPLSGKPYYNKKDPAYVTALEAANVNNDLYSPEVLDLFKKVKRIKTPKDGSKLTDKQKKKNAEQEKINMDALAEFNKIINKGVQDGTIPMKDAAVLVAAAYQSTNGLIKIAIPFTAVSDVAGAALRGKRKSKGEGFIEEHSPPVSSLGGAMLWGYANNASDLVMEGIRNNAIQVQLSNADDFKLDLAGLDAKLAEGTSILTPNAGYIRLAAAGINLNTITDLKTGKPVAESLGLSLPVEFYNNPDAVNYQNKLLFDVAKGDLDITKAKTRLKNSLPVQQSKKVQAVNFAENIGPEIVTPEMTAEQQKTVMVNSLKTRVQASKKSPKPKGISIFDFDDTLAKTKEKVIVNMPDGSVNEISAAEFAKEAGNLIEAGAKFDFSNFENVAEGTAEGPLADLARKRQGKFGSGDIFVLTARPNSAGPAIQQFLKSIGINIPLSNITGLADGSPQAKVDFVLNKTAEGYNDFYFADDSFANVEAVSKILDAVDIKNKVEQALPKEVKLNNDFNKQLEEVTGKETFKKYSDARARLEGQQKDKGLLKRFINQFKITPSADDFMGLMYAFAGKGEQGNKHLKFIKDNLIDPYNKAEQELLSAKVRVANDFAALKKQFPNLKSKRGKNPLLEEIGVGPYTKSQAVRVYNWAKQGLEIPGMSKRDVDALVKAVEKDNELNVFADELGLIQKGEKYPAPEANWLAGDIKTDILRGLDTTFRKQLMSEFNENSDIIFSPENLNKIEAIYGSKYREALEDSLRRMKSGSNRPVFVGSGARIVNEMMDWLNSSVGAVMFLNMRSGLLQMISNVNFINWGDNNMYKAAKAFASKDYFPTVLKLMNSDYLVNRRDGLKINVNEAELADAGRKGGIKGMINYILDKGFAITRIMDTLAIATGGATFFINRKAALQNRVNEKTGKLYTEAEAEQQAFDDFYAIAEETQQSSNPSKISQQQASFAGRIILSFQNVTMQYNRKTKKSIQDLYNRRKKPGMTQRESDLSNMSSIIYYVGMQNLLFQGLQQGLFALAFDDDEEDNEKEKANAADIINGMSDSLLFGLGFGGAIVSTVKNILIRVADEKEKKTTQYREIIWDVFNLSPVLDSKVRKLRTAAKTFDWNMKEIKRRGWSIDNPAYLAISQIISATTNLPIDRALQKLNNMRQATDEQTKTWQRVALFLGWSGWNFGLPYWGRQSTIDKEAKDLEKIKEKYKNDIRKFKNMGFTKKIPLSGPNAIKPTGELGVDYIQVERPDGTLQYYVKPKK